MPGEWWRYSEQPEGPLTANTACKYGPKASVPQCQKTTLLTLSEQHNISPARRLLGSRRAGFYEKEAAY